MIVNRLTVAAVLLCLVPLLESCSGFPGYVSDHWPHWAGGMPSDVPPRPGAPGYDEFIAHGQTDPAATNATATGSTPAGDKPAAAAPKFSVQPAPAAPAAPVAPAKPVAPAESAGNPPSQDSSVVRGGLY